MAKDIEPSLYGLIGHPVSHSFSPAIQNAAFAKLRMNAIYILFPIEPDKFGKGLRNVLKLGVKGLNVTIPFKEKVIGFLDKVSPEAKMVGAVNTVVVKSKRLYGYNTDGNGFIKALRLDAGRSPKGKKVFMFGAGGAAKSVGFALALEGASSLMICDILEKKAKMLASRINRYTRCKAKTVSIKKKKDMAKEIAEAHMLINATPCGMKKTDPPLLNRKLLHKGLVVCDLIYNPSQTKLIKDAKRKKLVAINGMGMLLHQGALSFKLWTGRKAPIVAMKEALFDKISDA